MTENGDEKPTFSSRLKEKRIAKGRTNPNILYLESDPEQKPKLETVDALAAELGWPIQEARRLAGYQEIDDNLTPLEVVSQCEEASGTAGSDGIPVLELADLDDFDDLDEQIGE